MRRRWVGLSAVTLASLMIVLDASVVNIALLPVQADLRGPAIVGRHGQHAALIGAGSLATLGWQ